MLKAYCILIIDNREQTNHIELFFSKPEKNEVKRRNNTLRTQLKAGDYTFMIMPNEYLNNNQPIMFQNQLIIEKKSGNIWEGGGYAEMKNNISGSGHSNFKKEFQFPVKNLILLLENTESESDLFKVKRGINNKVYFKAYKSFLENRNSERQQKGLNKIKVLHCKAMDSGLIVKELILNYVIENIEFIKTLV